MPPKGKSKRTHTKEKGRGRKKAVVPSPQPRRLIPIDESEKEDLEKREKTTEPSPEELVEEKRQSEAAKKSQKERKSLVGCEMNKKKPKCWNGLRNTPASGTSNTVLGTQGRLLHDSPLH